MYKIRITILSVIGCILLAPPDPLFTHSHPALWTWCWCGWCQNAPLVLAFCWVFPEWREWALSIDDRVCGLTAPPPPPPPQLEQPSAQSSLWVQATTSLSITSLGARPCPLGFPNTPLTPFQCSSFMKHSSNYPSGPWLIHLLNLFGGLKLSEVICKGQSTVVCLLLLFAYRKGLINRTLSYFLR